MKKLILKEYGLYGRVEVMLPIHTNLMANTTYDLHSNTFEMPPVLTN